jgi:hypothetical protein
MAAGRGYVSVGTDAYVDREGRPGNVAYVFMIAIVVLILGVLPPVLMIAAGGDVGDALLGGGYFTLFLLAVFGWSIRDDNRKSPDQVRLAIDAAGIYLQGGRLPAWKPGRIPWPDVAEVVLSTRRAGMPPFPYLRVEVRLKEPLRDRRGRPQAVGPSVTARLAHAGQITAAVRRHAPRVPVTRH